MTKSSKKFLTTRTRLDNKKVNEAVKVIMDALEEEEIEETIGLAAMQMLLNYFRDHGAFEEISFYPPEDA